MTDNDPIDSAWRAFNEGRELRAHIEAVSDEHARAALWGLLEIVRTQTEIIHLLAGSGESDLDRD